MSDEQATSTGRLVLVLSIVASAALVVLTALGTTLVDLLTPFIVGPVLLIVGLSFAVVAVWSLVRLRHIRRKGWTVAAPAAVCGLAVAMLFALPISGPHPSDDEMIRSFREHKQDYETLLQMFQLDAGLDRLGDLAGDWPENPVDVGVDEARLTRYRSLMLQLDVHSLERYIDNQVLFVTSTFGLAVSGSMKGYVYSEKPPTPLVGDTERDAVGPIGEVYRHIEGGWYLIYEWDA